MLVALAFYDLCAVLSPCGPLKALVKLAQERQDPIPGLVYEADVDTPEDDRVDTEFRNTLSSGGRFTGASSEADAAALPVTHPETSTTAVPSDASGALSADHDDVRPVVDTPSADDIEAGDLGAGTLEDTSALHAVDGGAKDSGGAVPEEAATEGDAALAAALAAEEAGAMSAEASQQDEEPGRRSIKLGLGDFVFYSVLVSRGALFDFTTLAACFVGVLMVSVAQTWQRMGFCIR